MEPPRLPWPAVEVSPMLLAPLAWLGPFVLAAQPQELIVHGELGAKLDDYLNRCAAFGFSGSVLVEKKGEVVLSKGYGLADRRTGVANAPDTIHDIGSLTKQFTAAAVLRLEQDGKLSVDDEIAKHVPDVPADKSKIRIEHLLAHTSGLPRGNERIGSVLQDRGEFLKILFNLPLEAKPGERHVYSNIGYDLLAVIVEEASDQRFETYLAENLFRPAGFESTGFRGERNLAVARSARGNDGPAQVDLPGSMIQGETETKWDPTLATEGWYSWGLRGAGGVLTTTLDLRRWHAALASDSVLNEKARAKLFDPVAENYAYGWYVLKSPRRTRWIEHGGTTGNGFDCKMTMYPDEDVLMIVLGNVGGMIVPYVNINVGKLVFGEKVEWPPEVRTADANELKELEGGYEGPSGARFTVEAADGAVVLCAENAAALALIAPPVSDRNEKLMERSEKIAAELKKDRFTALHAAERKEKPLFFFDDWWKSLEGKHGARKELTVLGGTEDAREETVTALIDLRFERGREIMKLEWSGEYLTGVRIGPPYPSRVRLAACSDERLVCFDLKSSRLVAELKSAAGRVELVTGGKALALRRAKR